MHIHSDIDEQTYLLTYWHSDTLTLGASTTVPHATITVPHTAWHHCITSSKPSLQLCSSHTLHIATYTSSEQSFETLWHTYITHFCITSLQEVRCNHNSKLTPKLAPAPALHSTRTSNLHIQLTLQRHTHTPYSGPAAMMNAMMYRALRTP